MVTAQYTPKAIIYQSEYDLIARFVMDYPNVETGGDLFGFWTKEGNPAIHYITGPGKKTKRTATSFFQDIDYLKECGDVLNSKYGMQHIGAWHSHHNLGLSHPSSGDVSTMRHTLETTNFTRFLISICNIVNGSRVSINGFLFSRDNSNDYAPCSWSILEGTSPHRTSLDKQNPGFFIYPLGNKEQTNIREKGIVETPEKGNAAEKPDLSEKSYWKTEKGKSYLKNIYEKLKNEHSVSNVEILQLSDKRLALSFTYQDGEYEIRFPENFPDSSAEVVKKHSSNGSFVRNIFRGKKNTDVRAFIYSLGILEPNRIIVITNK